MESTSRATRTIDWKSGAVAGLVAGVVFMMLEMVMVPLFLDGSPWGPPRMIGAIALGKAVLPPPATFSVGVVAVAMIVHFVLSAIYGVVLGLIIGRMQKTAAILVGGGYGLALYLINFYVFTAVFPWFANARNWVSVFAHIVFGLVLAWFYLRKTRPTKAA